MRPVKKQCLLTTTGCACAASSSRHVAFCRASATRCTRLQARIALGYEKVPVLRNRRRALVVVESPLDSFGPGAQLACAAHCCLTSHCCCLLTMRPPDALPSALYTDVYSDKDPAASPFTPPSKAMRVWMRESDDRVRSK